MVLLQDWKGTGGGLWPVPYLFCRLLLAPNRQHPVAFSVGLCVQPRRNFSDSPGIPSPGKAGRDGVAARNDR
jgi:hypothetical protein